METWLKNLLAYSVELIKILIVTCGIMGFRLKVKRRHILIMLFSLGAILLISKSSYFNTMSLINGLLAAISSVFMIIGSHRLVCALLAYLSVSMLDTATAAVIMFVTGLDTSGLYDSSLFHISANVISVILITAVSIAQRTIKKPSPVFTHLRTAYIVTALISQFCFLLYLTPALVLGFDGYSKPVIALCLSFSGLFFIISNIMTAEFAFSKKRFRSLYYNARSRSENLSDYLGSRLEKEKEKRKLFHDMPYHLLSLQSLVKRNNSAELERYIEKLTERLFDCGQAVSTGNHQLNAIISGCIAKYPNAKAEIDGVMPDKLSIPLHDFCIILSNLLDNAFREGDKMSGTVSIEIKVKEDILYIRIINPVKKKVRITGNEIQQDFKEGHGIGSLNVSEYTAKNKGRVFYHCDGKCFIADVYLSL